MLSQARLTSLTTRCCTDAYCHSLQGTFDGEVVKILKFYGDKQRQLLSRLDELQTDIDALPTQVRRNDVAGVCIAVRMDRRLLAFNTPQSRDGSMLTAANQCNSAPQRSLAMTSGSQQ